MRLWERLLVVAALLSVVSIIGVGLGGERTSPLEGPGAGSLVAGTGLGQSSARQPPEMRGSVTPGGIPGDEAVAQVERGRFGMAGSRSGEAMHDAPVASFLDRQLVELSGGSSPQAAPDLAGLSGVGGRVTGMVGDPLRPQRVDRPVLAGAVS